MCVCVCVLFLFRGCVVPTISCLGCPYIHILDSDKLYTRHGTQKVSARNQTRNYPVSQAYLCLGVL